MPWESVCVDLIGPWKIILDGEDDEDGIELTFNALTSIDPVSNLVEATRLRNKTSKHISKQFANSWLCRYPRAVRCVHDNGSEFIAHEFQELLEQAGIKSVPTSVKNPQANAICERMHKTFAAILRTTMRANPPKDEEDAEDIMDDALSTCVHALRCAINHTMQTSPGAMVFNRDMLMQVPLIADLDAIRGRRQQLIDNNLLRTNNKRVDYNYAVDGKAYVKVHEPNKLQEVLHGPYRITRIYTNGTVEIQLNPDTFDRVNIRKLVPYKGL